MSLFRDLIRRKAAPPVVQRPSSSRSASQSPNLAASATQPRSTTLGSHDQNHDGQKRTKQDHTSAEGKGHLFDGVNIGGYSRAQLGNVYAENVSYNFGPASPYGRREDEPSLSEQHLVAGESRSEGMRRLELLESLKFDAMGARLATVNAAHEQTCSWIMDTLEYMRWQNKSLWSEHHGVLWIKGNPGAGKSTLMKYALGVAQLADGAAVLVPFFFNARGEAIERSTEGMYRSLLHRLLTKLPHLYSSQSLPSRDNWSVELLESMLRTVVLSLRPDETVTFYIDALDECEEHEVRDVVAFFEDLGNLAISHNIRFCLCLSSRHYPHITMDMYEELRLDDQDEHLRDISKYVKSSLSRLSVPDAVKNDIKANIESRSAGVFLWVVLVLKLLRETWDNGATHSELVASLQKVPSRLRDLFASILEHPDNDTLSAFRWVLYKKHELSCPELYFAIKTSAGQLSTGVWNENDASKDSMRRFILYKTRGLVEVTGHFVRFIHESVREHLLAGGLAGLTEQDQHTLEEASGHMMMARCCMTYIELDASTYLQHPSGVHSALVAGNFPLLRYVMRSIYHHMKIAHSGRALQVEQLGIFSAPLLLHASRFLREFDRSTLPARNAERATMLCLLIEEGALSLAGDLLACRAKFELSSPLNHPLSGNTKPPYLNFDINARCGGHHGSALGSAVASGDVALLQLLIDHGAHVNQRGGLFGSPLLIAVGARSDDCAKLLLQHGADVHLTLRDGTNALTKAAFDGSYDMLRMLLDHGAQLTSTGLKYGSLLGATISGRWYWAHNSTQYQGHGDVMSFLLTSGVQVNTWSKKSPLWVAAYHHDSDMVRWLSEKGADVDARDHKNWSTPLYMVASAKPERYRSANRNANNQKATIKALLEVGADVNAICAPCGTPLIAAAAENLPDVVLLLLVRGAGIHYRGDFGTARDVAIEKGHDEVAELLQSYEVTEQTKGILPLAVTKQDNATTAVETDT